MIRKILDKLTADKFWHFALAALTAFTLRIALAAFIPYRTAALIAVSLTFLACVGKELIYDKWMKKGTPEWLDLIMGILGIIIATL